MDVVGRRSTSTMSQKRPLLYDSLTLRSQSNTPNGEVSSATVFHYHQSADQPHIVWAEYSGGSIVRGHLIGTLDANGSNVLRMRYQHINEAGKLMTGMCTSTPEVLEDGRLRLDEQWEWTSGGEGQGSSIVEEDATHSSPN